MDHEQFKKKKKYKKEKIKQKVKEINEMIIIKMFRMNLKKITIYIKEKL